MHKKLFCLVYMMFFCIILGACGNQNNADNIESNELMALSWQDMTWTNESLEYASQFSVERYNDYRLITIVDSGRFLLVEENDEVPKDMPGDVVLLKKPLDKVYLVASNGFDPVSTINALDHVILSGVKKENLFIDEAVNQMDSGNIEYAGKYSAPDYELLLTKGCNLAIENSMIYHSPETKEKLESLGIPVVVEKSSYESNPLGRLEWIKLYGLLLDKEEEAKASFDKQLDIIKSIESNKKAETTPVTIAFFHVNSNGLINVRKPNDYIVKLIEMAGAKYALSSMECDEENSLSTVNMSMEEFYVYAKTADYLIYNSTIVGEIHTIDELIEKNAVFNEFTAVKTGRVYCTERDFFQEVSGMGNLMADINKLSTGDEAGEFNYLVKLQ